MLIGIGYNCNIVGGEPGASLGIGKCSHSLDDTDFTIVLFLYMKKGKDVDQVFNDKF